MRKFVGPILMACLVLWSLFLARHCHAWYAGYSSASNVTSVWGSADPNVCATCTQGQSWVLTYGSRYVQVYTDATGRIWRVDSTSSPVFIASTYSGSAVSVSLSKGATTIVNINVGYRDAGNVARTYTKAVSIPGWLVNYGAPQVWSYGPESQAPLAVLDAWVSTMPVNSSKMTSGGSVCGQTGGFTAKRTCP